MASLTPNTNPIEDLKTSTDASKASPQDEIIEYEPRMDLHYVKGLENFQLYNKGGLHPVHLDDILDGRFEVFHKLGSGGFGTVWLCRDIMLEKWRAVKIMAANPSSMGNEERMTDYLRSHFSQRELEDNHISTPLEQFWLDGPNGRHRCFVLPVLGWTLSDWRMNQNDYEEEGIENINNVSRQIIKALHFLHNHGICHGDFRPDNILMKIEGIDELDKDQITDIMGEPELVEMETISGQPPAPRAPEYAVIPAEYGWCKKLSTNSISIIDFGESFFTHTPPETTGIPSFYGAPEVLFQGTRELGPPTDMWSLACTLYEVWEQQPLFVPLFNSNFTAIVGEIESYLGELPQSYRTVYIEMLREYRREFLVKNEVSEAQSETRKPSSGEESQPVPQELGQTSKTSDKSTQETKPTRTFKAILGGEKSRCIKVPSSKTKEMIKYRYPQKDVLGLSDLLTNMLRYEPDQRIDINAVASHPWVGIKPRYPSITNLVSKKSLCYASMTILSLSIVTMATWAFARRGLLSTVSKGRSVPLQCLCTFVKQ